MELRLRKTGRHLSVSSVSSIPGSMGEINKIITSNLVPTVKAAKSSINAAVQKTSAHIKAWAMEHMVQAQKLGRKTDLFEKLVNDPRTATEQLAMRLLLGEQAVEHTKHVQQQKAQKDEEQKMDDLLDSIGL